MEILHHKQYQDLLDYLSNVKTSLKGWQLVDVKLLEEADAKHLTSVDVAERINGLFHADKGKIYICDDHNIAMLINWGARNPQHISQTIEADLPNGSCSVQSCEPTIEGLGNLEITIRPSRVQAMQTYADIRKLRSKNVVLVADDDMYMRLLVQKGIGSLAAVHESDNGQNLLELYRELIPDILFLDIHLPECNGLQLLLDIIKLDPRAFTIMLSSDSSPDNVKTSVYRGAKGFMAKPFSREKLLEQIKRCPTFNLGH